jgi:hypothetical protein
MLRIVLVLGITAAFGQVVADIADRLLFDRPAVVQKSEPPCMASVVNDLGVISGEIPCDQVPPGPVTCYGANIKPIPCPKAALR